MTHTLVGAALARTRIARGTRLGAAALLVGANLPDVDILSSFAGSDAALGFRRGWTHGPLAVLVLPVLWTAVLVAWDRRVGRRGPDSTPARAGALLGLALLACATHPLLDWMNTYGVRWLMPFDGRWYYGDALFIVDPWLWLLLGGAVYLARERRGFPWGWAILGGLASWIVLAASDVVPAAARAVWAAGLLSFVALRVLSRGAAWRARAPAAALLVAALYVGAMVVSTTLASAWIRADLARRGATGVGRMMVGPRPANPFAWDLVGDAGDGYVHGRFAWLPRPALDLAPERIAKPAPSPVLDAARAAPGIRGALGWMRFPYAEIDETADGYTVYLLDARYTRTRSRGFGAAVVELDRDLGVRAVQEARRR